MSEKPEVRAEEAELSDDALEQVAGGCQIDSHLQDPITTKFPPEYPAAIEF